MFWAVWEWLQLSLPAPVALGAVAVLGYLFGRSRFSTKDLLDAAARREMKRAQAVARELTAIATHAHNDVLLFENHVGRFKERVQLLSHEERNEASWQELCREAEVLLRPTQRLATQLAACYDELRHQSSHLMSFTEVRTDPLTGVCNRRALDESLVSMLSMLNRYDSGFSLVMVDIDLFKKINDEHGHLYGDQILIDVAKLMDQNIRDTDQVSRYGGEEFVIIMPHTQLEGAAIFGDRSRARVAQMLPLTISCGAAMAVSDDTPQSLLARADAALYQAKQNGRNRLCMHNGTSVAAFESAEKEQRESVTTPPPAAASSIPRAFPEQPAPCEIDLTALAGQATITH
jgi:diguanylate cyclase (GGDEF)-like protein